LQNTALNTKQYTSEHNNEHQR